MMCGQIAMICAPLAMDWLSRSTSTLPFYVTGIIGLVVVVCMFTISRMPGGLLAGRATREDLEKGEKPSDNAVEETKEVEMAEAGEKGGVLVMDVEGVSSASVEKGVLSASVEKGISADAKGITPPADIATITSEKGETTNPAPWIVCSQRRKQTHEMDWQTM